jgi:hypothetical protein
MSMDIRRVVDQVRPDAIHLTGASTTAVDRVIVVGGVFGSGSRGLGVGVFGAIVARPEDLRPCAVAVAGERRRVVGIR